MTSTREVTRCRVENHDPVGHDANTDRNCPSGHRRDLRGRHRRHHRPGEAGVRGQGESQRGSQARTEGEEGGVVSIARKKCANLPPFFFLSHLKSAQGEPAWVSPCKTLIPPPALARRILAA